MPTEDTPLEQVGGESSPHLPISARPDLTPWGFPRLRLCPKCEYLLVGLPAPHHCPECGLEYDEFSCDWVAEQHSMATIIRRYLSYSAVICTLYALPFVLAAFGDPGPRISMWWVALLTWCFLLVIVFVAFMAARRYSRRKVSSIALLPDGVCYGAPGAGINMISWRAVRTTRVRRIWRWQFPALTFGRGLFPMGIDLWQVLSTRQAAEEFARAVQLGKQRYAGAQDSLKPGSA